jgi:hypothetical protein
MTEDTAFSLAIEWGLDLEFSPRGGVKVRRQRWFEIHDSRWFPGFLRDLVTESLEAVWNASRTYHPIAGRLREALERTGSMAVVDLCSGGGGPWTGLYEEVAAGSELRVRLTDRYPSRMAVEAATGWQPHVAAWSEPVDACHIPQELSGFRTVFSAFHHFDPEAARTILADAVARREGIAVFEGARRDWWTVLAVTAVPLLALREGARARPVRWKRILWSFVLPVVPAVLWVDGLLSCLRSYSLEDLREMTVGLGDYAWQVGDERGGRVPIRYLIGMPRSGD